MTWKGALLRSLSRASAVSLLIAGLLLVSETLHLVLRNPYFVFDLGADIFRVVGWYAAGSLVLGAAVGLVIRSTRWQRFALAASYYVIVSVKILGFDANLLSSAPVALAFVAFSAVTFAGMAYGAARSAMSSVLPVLFVAAYTNICLGIASGWALGGGRLTTFLIAPRTLVIALAGSSAFVVVGWLQQRLERRTERWPLVLLHASIVVSLLAVSAVASRIPPTRGDAIAGSTDTERPDLYVLSFDALRTDALESFVARNPSSHLAGVRQRSLIFENVVSHGAATDAILANNTFAGAPWTNCATSVPGDLSGHGYFTAMIFGRVGRRFEGSVCYEYYFSGDGHSLITRYAVPRLVAHVTSRSAGMRDKYLPAALLLDKLEEVANLPVPVYAYVHFLELHAPYVPASRAQDASYLRSLGDFMRRCYNELCDPQDRENAPLIEAARGAYADTMVEVDQAVGRALTIARRRGRRFVLVVTADHGELFGEHGGFAHSGGFVSELLDVPFLVHDSHEGTTARRCELMLSSEAIQATARGLANPATQRFPNHDVLVVESPPLGKAQVERQTNSIRYELSADMLPHAGTWRNIHRERSGTSPYPIAQCK